MTDEILYEDELGEEESLTDFCNVLLLRNQLVNGSLDSLMETYSDYDEYLNFLDTFRVMTEIDSAFLLYDDKFLEKISSIVQLFRYEKVDEEVKNAIDSIILYINKVRSYKSQYKQLLMISYKDYHEQTRNITFENDEDLVYSLGYDAVVYIALIKDKLYLITDPCAFYSTINYFNVTIPGMIDDEVVRERIMKKMKEFDNDKKNHNKDIRRYAKSTKKIFKKSKKEE